MAGLEPKYYSHPLCSFEYFNGIFRRTGLPNFVDSHARRVNSRYLSDIKKASDVI